MKLLHTDNGIMEQVKESLLKTSLLSSFNAGQVGELASLGQLEKYDKGETIPDSSSGSNRFYLVIDGSIESQSGSNGEDSLAFFGLEQVFGPGRSGEKVTASEDLTVLRFTSEQLERVYRQMPDFGLALTRYLVNGKDEKGDRNSSIPSQVDSEVFSMLPMGFIVRHRVIPLFSEGNEFILGSVDKPRPQVTSFVQQILPGMEINTVRIKVDQFNTILQSNSTVREWVSPDEESEVLSDESSGLEIKAREVHSIPSLDTMLGRMLEEGASDLHLTAGNPAYWRIDGQIKAISDSAPLTHDDVWKLFDPLLTDHQREQFEAASEVDFSYTSAAGIRSRVALFKDFKGFNAAMRLIPTKILTLEQLGLPQNLTKLCDHPNGLVLVTGPAGSGKSTTLAAMLDYVNKNRREHIVTLEDPIEFIHENNKSIFNQREVGVHTRTFGSGLKSALREDPDILLVGEMRDLETISLTLELANTGHLAFATMHTSTAIGTLDRLVQVFPFDQQSKVAALIGDTLRGIVTQTLCARKNGGRVAAVEVLIVDTAVSHLIRESKSHQVINTMQTGKSQGNMTMNESLARLVKGKKITIEEALRHSNDKKDLDKRL